MNVVIRDAETLGQVIRERRKLAGVRIDDAAALCGIAVSTLSAMENGSRPAGIDKILPVLEKLGLRLIVESDE
ncbi:MAG: helix-turn-helix transcriptional regulator [Proteobacteria bacterium]|nr:helix-turn-helix transcriptional regulator [Pseudomonadota bacterium]